MLCHRMWPSSFAASGFHFTVLWGSAAMLVVTGMVGAHERENQAPVKHPAESDQPRLALRTGWDSRYHTEGRDALDGDSLWRTSLEWSQGPAGFGLWYGNSPDQSYDELQLSAALRQSYGDLQAYVGYTHYRFPFEGADDHELGAGLAYAGCPIGIEYALDVYHSFEADGFFAEATASREWQLDDKWSASFSAVFGMNQGYVADGHDGANHLAASIGLSRALSESLSLNIHATYNWGIDRKVTAPDDAFLRDFFHAGVGLQWNF